MELFYKVRATKLEREIGMIERQVHCADAIEWLRTQETLSQCSLIASLPDISEFHGYTLARWKEWFVETAKLVLSRCPDEGVTLFFQSDIKVDGVWVDKGYLCQKAAESLGHEELFHKVLCRFAPGTRTFGRPAYSHLLAFSKGVKVDSSKSTADVVPDLGDKIWERGMGLEACLIATEFIKTQTQTKTVVNPFCGQGSVLAVANALELNAIGIERSPKRVEFAKALQVDLKEKKWLATSIPK